MSKIKIFIAVLFVTVSFVSLPTSGLANSYQENFNDSQATGNPIFEILSLLSAFCADDDCGIVGSKPHSLQDSLEPKCYGLQNGAQCWKEVANRSGCFVWDEVLNVAQTVTWYGACDNGVGNGDGRLVWTDGNFSFEQMGSLTNGKFNGYWTYRDSDGASAEGPYVEGKQHGHWIFQYVDGTVAQGPYVNGKRLGHWTFQYINGTVAQGRLVGDKRNGHWTVRTADGRMKWINVDSF